MEITLIALPKLFILKFKVYLKLFASLSTRWGYLRNSEISQVKTESLWPLVAKDTEGQGLSGVLTLSAFL